MQIFLSYPSEKLADARQVFQFIRHLGIETWFDKESLIGGQDWDRERAAAQRRADLTLLVCAPEIVDRRGVIQREIKEMLEQIEELPLGDIYIVPLRAEDFRLPPDLAKFQYIDLFKDDWQVRVARSLKLRFEQLGQELPDKLKLIDPEDIRLPKHQVAMSDDRIKIEGEYRGYSEKGTYWDLVNATLREFALREAFEWRRQLNAIYAGDIEKGYASPNMRWNLKTEEFFRQNMILSLRLYETTYAGGAHSNYTVSTMNFGGEEFGTARFDELLGMDEEFFKHIQAFVDTDVKQKRGLNPHWGTDKARIRKMFGKFSLDTVGITFIFDPYDVASFAAGFIESLVPWCEIGNRLPPPYRRSQLGLLIESALADERLRSS